MILEIIFSGRSWIHWTKAAITAQENINQGRLVPLPYPSYTDVMRIHVATDHAGLDFKTKLVDHLSAAGHEVIDHGAYNFNPDDDYPEFIIKAAEAVATDQKQGIQTLGIIFGGSGNGEQIAANKVTGIRAALVWSEATAKLARQHNDANIISIGARQHNETEALNLIDIFINEPFSNQERHSRRIGQIANYEQSNKSQ